MKSAVSLALLAALVCLTSQATVSNETQLRKYWGFFNFVAATPTDRGLGSRASSCPELVGIQLFKDPSSGLFSLQAREFDPATGDDLSFGGQGLEDWELPYAYYHSLFENIGGPAKKFTSWNQISDGFSTPLQDFQFRNVVVTISSSLEADGRVAQRVSFKPYSFGIFPHGKPEVQDLILQIKETPGKATHLFLTKYLNGKELRNCDYQKDEKRGFPSFKKN